MSAPDPVADLGARLAAADAHLFYEVTPLLPEFWTGIPVVAAALAGRFLARMPDRVSFFHDDTLIGHEDVREALERRTGAFLAHEMHRRTRPFRPLDLYARSGLNLGFYPSAKREGGMFDREVSVVHDISTLVTPEYHAAKNIRYHLEHLYDEVASNDLTVCVSDATLEDVVHYFGTDPARLVQMNNAVAWPEEHALRFAAETGGLLPEPFVLVLGTREPRKNHQLIFDMLARQPGILEHYRFVFVGGAGWLEDKVSVPEPVRQGFASGRILHAGFIDEYTKYKLLRACAFSIYASLFEGFGLPVLESLSLGRPCIASCSSSLPEAGRDAALYFDPLSAADLYARIVEMHRMAPHERAELSRRCLAAAGAFSWDASFGVLCAALARLV